ncbi:hypothetical protein FFLO_02583 [Filobasidium floriforme]|uniref:Uncharacterized protein n=1 Tax=Filobasidium floriforme TaxID=5210 RepID=A0A8K0JNT1_9TREE|nr:uncharacterized protein HD553DRAFT_308204 [Filobasidium floriforme]KAG7561943.1 hypothetical protein FFLO_02583 [Filobasidium floriforme]KAH8087439.1 hypothetical protein HD553DRAFT_308204 [Filobasidium floriforme]
MSTSSNFAALLRKSKFASHDPLITRIYTAPTASRSKGDWGLKYTLPASTATRPQSRYIRLRSLDAGQGLGCDYVSGEKEARLMETWGDGRYGWNREDSDASKSDSSSLYKQTRRQVGGRNQSGYATSRSDSVDLDPWFEPKNTGDNASEEVKLYLSDVEGMSEEHFEKHLSKIRASRERFAQTLTERGDKPLFEYRQTGGALVEEAAPSFLANDARSEHARVTSPDSIAPRPHKTSGMAYSEGSHADSQLHPLMSLPGRVLNGVNRSQLHQEAAWQRSKKALSTAFVGQSRIPYEDDITDMKVVGLAGLTAKMPRARSEGLSSMDPTGTDPETKSTSTFRVTSARIEAPPSVVASMPASNLSSVALNDQSIRHVTPHSRDHASAASQHPLESMRFELQVAASGQADQLNRAQNGGDRLVGQKGWVGAERKNDLLEMARHMSGSSRTGGRQFGAAGRRVARAEEHERQKDSMDDIQKLLSDLGNLNNADRAAGFTGKRGYHTSAVRRSSDKDDLPTASIGPGEAKGSEPIGGPGVGGNTQKEAGPAGSLAKGEWRQLEENVAGESRYGENLDEKKE